jgi:hypothetical protein
MKAPRDFIQEAAPGNWFEISSGRDIPQNCPACDIAGRP